MDETESYDHRSTALTVGQLRAVIAELPDGMPVMVAAPERIDDSLRSIINAVGAEVRPTVDSFGERLLIVGSAPSGTYQRPRHGRLTVMGLTTDGSATSYEQIAALQEAVESATRSAGHRGEWWMTSDEEAGLLTWTWTHSNVPISDVVNAALDAARALDPGTWQVRPEYVSEGSKLV